MARLFALASTQYLDATNTPWTDYPLTMACWFRTGADVTTNQNLIDVGTLDSTNDCHIGIGVQTSQVYGFCSNDAASFSNATLGSPTLSTNTWYFAAFVCASATSRTIYLDSSANASTDTNSRAITGATPTGIAIGAYVNGAGAFGPFGGRVAEAALWNVALTGAEIDSLGKAFAPSFIRPGNILNYWPLVGRKSPETDNFGGVNLTLRNTPTTADHPRVIYPSRPMIGHNSAGAAPGGLDIPIAYHHYRTMHTA